MAEKHDPNEKKMNESGEQQMIYDTVFKLLGISLFSCEEDIDIHEWEPVYEEMKAQTVAAIPEKWLKSHLPSAKPWLDYCTQNIWQWVRVMHGQDQILKILESHNIPCVIIKGSAAAMAYPDPMFRSMGDVDVLVKRADLDSAAEVLESNGYQLTEDKDMVSHHYNYTKDNISFELHKRLPVIDDANEELLAMFEEGIESRVWNDIDNYHFPTLPPILNGLVLIFHINQHLRSGLGLRQIIDWMEYVDRLDDEKLAELLPLLRSTGMEHLALTTTAMCKRYLGLQRSIPGSEDVDPQVCDALMNHIMEKGNFGRKAIGIDEDITSFTLSTTERGGIFKRLQAGGLCRWEAAKKHKILRPFAWIYQSFRIIGVLIKNNKGLKAIRTQRQKGMEERRLLESLGLNVDRTIRETDKGNDTHQE